VLQDYVMNPMLFRGHKFDLRVWAVVLSIDPLRVHLLGSGIPKVTRKGGHGSKYRGGKGGACGVRVE
jgi:hypothetical protein